MADPIPSEVFLQGYAQADETPAHAFDAASLLSGLRGLEVAFTQCNAFAVDPELSAGERAEFAALSTAAFGIVRAMVGPSLCRFLDIVHAPATTESTRVEMRSYLSGFLSDAELDGLSEDEQCALLLERLRARGFPVPDGGH